MVDTAGVISKALKMARRACVLAFAMAAFAAFAVISVGLARANEVKVVATIKPLHSLVAGVMAGLDAPHLIVKGTGSPHSYSLRPSDARALEQARLVFWIGEGMETFLSDTLRKLARNAETVALAEAKTLTLYKMREGGDWAEHNHDDHDEDAHDKHHHDKTADNHDSHEETDMHLWLDPRNAVVMVKVIAAELAKAYPAHKKTFERNAKFYIAKLTTLEREIAAATAPVKTKPYVVFHDAYQYFEKRFGLNAAGSITVSPDRQPGAERVKEIRAKITSLGSTCVFAEPQFEPRLVRALITGTRARSGVLDPLGAGIPQGSEHYFKVMRGLVRALRQCLNPSG